MTLSFMITWLLILIVIGLSAGTYIKMRKYGLPKRLFALAPIVALLAFVIAPLFAMIVVVAWPTALHSKSNEEVVAKISSSNCIRRIIYAFEISAGMISSGPFTISILSYLLTSFIDKKMVSTEQQEIIKEYVTAVMA